MVAMFGLVFAVALIFILTGFFRTFRHSSQIFRMVERRIDEELARSTGPTAPTECSYCGSRIRDEAECPQCGAAVKERHDSRLPEEPSA